MKQILVSLVFLMAGSFASADSKVVAGDYAIDGAHSKVSFEIAHMVISSVDGRFQKYDGTIKLNDKFEKSKVSVTVDAASIDTGNAKRDDHLRSPEFFDVAKFKEIKFESKKIEGTPESFKLTGELTMHGVKKTVTFDAKYLGFVHNEMYNKDVVAFSATTKVNRQDYGLKWNKAIEAGPMVGDEVTIKLAFEAGKDAPAAAKK